MTWHTKFFIFLVIISITLVMNAWAIPPFFEARIKAPPFVRFYSAGRELPTIRKEKFYLMHVPGTVKFPLVMNVVGPMGGLYEAELSSLQKLKGFKVPVGIIKNKDANPRKLEKLPQFCPRVKIIPDNAGVPHFLYDAHDDRLNRFPAYQLFEPDLLTGSQISSLTQMDTKNVLKIRSVQISYDYEDTGIVDYAGPHPLTQEPHKVYEGDGGFYANFHYAVLPYEKEIMQLDRQTLLHLVQGNLADVDKEHLRPALRTHAFIPGPYLSGDKYLYPFCEWGDTAHQAPVQKMAYKNMAIWDWDYSVPNADHIILVVWEGDEEDWLVERKLIHPFYLTDDVVGIWEIKKNATIQPLTLKNQNGDFEMTVVSGNL